MALTELKRIAREGFVLLFIMMMLLVGMLTTAKVAYLAPIMELFLLFYASFTGWSLFDREHQEGAMEYVLSLPVSRMKLLILKLLPRFLAILFVLLVYYLIFREFEQYFFLTFFNLVLLYLIFFFLSISWSLSIRSFLGAFLMTAFLTGGLFLLIQYLNPSKSENEVLFHSALTLLIFPFLFIVFFNKYDAKPIAYFHKRFIPVASLLLVIGIGLFYFVSGPTYLTYFLTGKGSLFKLVGKTTTLIRENGKKIMIPALLTPLFEVNQHQMLASLRNHKQDSQKLVLLNTSDGEYKEVFEPTPGWWFHSTTGTKMGRRIFLLLTSSDHQEYKIIQWDGNIVKEFPLYNDFEDGAIHSINGVNSNPLQFIHFPGKKVYRSFENGECEELFEANRVKVWEDRLVVFNSKGLIVYKVGETLKKVFQEKGPIVPAYRGRGHLLKANIPVKMGNKFFVFNLANNEFLPLAIKRYPFDCISTTNGIRIIWVNGKKISTSVANLKDGHVDQEQIWYSSLNPEHLRIIRVFASGVLIQNRRTVEKYIYKNN
jgi:hypothetical protein